MQENTIPDITLGPVLNGLKAGEPSINGLKSGDTVINSAIQLNQLKLKLEKEGMNKVDKFYKNNGTIDDLLKIMSDGGDEFKKQTGRAMTYSEIREMYG